MKFLARHYQTQKTLEIEINQNRYSQIKSLTSSDKTLPYIAPGLVDIQINGFGGIDFNRPISSKEWEIACQALYAQGCTHFLATLITNTSDQIEKLLKNLVQLRQHNSFNCLGYHLEGPFLNPNPDYSGVHNSQWMIPCDIKLFEKWQTLSLNQIRLLTLAPEINLEKALLLIQEAVKNQVRIAIGHSSLTGSAFKQAIRSGVTGWTHLGNGLAQQIHKFENPLFFALAQPELFCSLIPDGLHLPAHVFAVLAKALDKRLLLTTDATAASGATEGSYTLGEIKITRDNQNHARKTGAEKLAGSTLTPFEAVFKASRLANYPWPLMWDAHSTRPAKWLGLSPHHLEKDNEASFCLFVDEPEPHLLATVHRGQSVFGKTPVQRATN